MTKFAISVGHGQYIRGASGAPVPPQLDEVDYCVRVVDRIADLLNSIDGMSAVKFFDQTSHDQSTNLKTITNWHNSQTRDYDVSCHLNAYNGSAHGCEVLYVTQESLASRLASAISAAGGFTNRGAKYRSDLSFLNNTEEPAVLLETAFCDHTGDCNSLNANFEKICEAIAETLAGKQVSEAPGGQPPIEQPPVEAPAENRVSIVIETKGDVLVTINGQDIQNLG
jgi:N-acetylmuramoyl-L-alanine amidase